MRLILVRHAHSEGNRKRIIQGQGDYELSERGLHEARLLADRLKNERIDRIYVSDLKRATRTAEPIAEHHPNADVTYDPRLRERDYGDYENRTKREIVSSGAEGASGTWVAPPRGEHLDEFTARVIGMLDELFEKHRGESVLIVSHSGVMTRLLLTIANATDDMYQTYRPPNASVTILEFDLEKNHTLHLLHCCEHLETSREDAHGQAHSAQGPSAPSRNTLETPPERPSPNEQRT